MLEFVTTASCQLGEQGGRGGALIRSSSRTLHAHGPWLGPRRLDAALMLSATRYLMGRLSSQHWPTHMLIPLPRHLSKECILPQLLQLMLHYACAKYQLLKKPILVGTASDAPVDKSTMSYVYPQG